MTSLTLSSRIGIRIASSPLLAEPAAVRRAALAAELLGYDAVWVVGSDPYLLVSVVEEVVRSTERIRIGVGMVVGDSGLDQVQRHALSTIQHLAGDRLTLGITVDAGLLPERAEHTVDLIQDGWDRSDDVPRLVLTARSEFAFDLLVRRADGWLADDVGVRELPERFAELQVRAEHHNRTRPIALVVPAWVALTDEPHAAGRADYEGDVNQVADDLVGAVQAGAQEVVLMPVGDPTLDELLDTCARVAEALADRLVAPV